MNIRTLHKIGYGLYIVSSKKGEKINGQIANTVFQVTAEPATIAVCINKENLTNEFIRDSKVFSVSILSTEADMKFIGKFGFKSGRDIDKFEGTEYKLGKTGAPIVLNYSVAYLEMEVIQTVEVETHTMFIGKVIDAEILNDKEPMSYSYYHEVKKGVAPKTASTYIDPKLLREEEKKEEPKMARYRCTVCGYLYDPKSGDPDSGIKPGTAFEEIPDTWVCPVCGVDKASFAKED